MDPHSVTPSGIARAPSGEEDEVMATDTARADEPERADGDMPDDDARRPVVLPDLDTEAAVRAALAIARDRRQQLVRDAHAPNTQRAYAADWRAFSTWCEQVARVEPQHRALPTSDDTLSTYIAHRVDLAPGSIRRAVSAIRLMHERHGYRKPSANSRT